MYVFQSNIAGTNDDDDHEHGNVDDDVDNSFPMIDSIASESSAAFCTGLHQGPHVEAQASDRTTQRMHSRHPPECP